MTRRNRPAWLPAAAVMRRTPWWIVEMRGVRCPVLRIDPAQRPRLAGIRDNLTARITEAEHEGWLGEAEGPRVSLAAAQGKLAETRRAGPACLHC
jgi:hypothetical protein